MRSKYFPQLIVRLTLPAFFVFMLLLPAGRSLAQNGKPDLQFTLSLPRASSHYFHVSLTCSGWNKDSLLLKMPSWMPGYYQLLNYSKEMEQLSATDNVGHALAIQNINNNTWIIRNVKNKTITLQYDIKTTRQFVANSYADSEHAYIIPCGAFLYIDGQLGIPATVKIILPSKLFSIATGLEKSPGKTNEYYAPNFDILYDCPILIGKLEALPSFKVKGIVHRFIGFKMGDFDKAKLMQNLQAIVEKSVEMMHDIPYKEYTFIGIGPGQGGIEHLNNCTVSFTGKGLETEAGMNRILFFLAHEYFHHFNVKRIRPYELGPFDYDKGSNTNLLWVSEGLSVYYEYLLVKRAGLVSEQTLFRSFEHSINAFENGIGKQFQSLVQSSYDTWSDGPFGKQGPEKDKSISYYDKGPAVGLLLDFAIRKQTNNNKSLDDVMRALYEKYYKQLHRGFTDAEFQQTAEQVAGTSLTPLFEYVYTTKELDYNRFFNDAGLQMEIENIGDAGKRKCVMNRLNNATLEQQKILEQWLGQQ